MGKSPRGTSPRHSPRYSPRLAITTSNTTATTTTAISSTAISSSGKSKGKLAQSPITTATSSSSSAGKVARLPVPAAEIDIEEYPFDAPFVAWMSSDGINLHPYDGPLNTNRDIYIHPHTNASSHTLPTHPVILKYPNNTPH